MRPSTEAGSLPSGPSGDASSSPVSDASPTAAAGLRVLVADDNRDTAESLSLLLRMMGHEVRSVTNGAAALEAAAEFRPEVALLDIGMPNLDGYEVARALRARFGRDLVLWAQSGWGQTEDRRRSREAGFDLHFVKPLDPLALERLLARKSSELALVREP